MWHEARQVPSWLIFDVGQSHMKLASLFLSLFLSVGVHFDGYATPILKEEVAVIRDHFKAELKERKPVILSEMSTIGVREPGRDWKSRLRRSAEKTSSEVREAVEHFIMQNEEDSSFAGLSVAGLNLTTVSKATLREIFADLLDGWGTFRKRFGAGHLHSLSRVGFSKSGRTAVYYAFTGSDWVTGEGHFRVVRKDGDIWIEDENVIIGWQVLS